MIYGLSTVAFTEDDAAVRAERLRRSRSTARAWTILDRERRLAAIERALRPANDDCLDDFPLAL